MNLCFDYLAEFAIVATEGSMSKAALKLCISQSALSRHLRTLESHLGVRLLERNHDGVALTDEGRYAFNRAVDMLETMDEIEFHFSRERMRKLLIDGLTVFPALEESARMAAKGCGVELAMRRDAHSLGDISFANALLRHETDIYLTMAPSSETDALASFDKREGLSIVTVLESPLVAVMELRNPLAAKEVLRMEDLDGQTLLHAQSDFDGEMVNWSNTKRLLRDASIEYRSKACTLVDESSLLADFKGGVLLFPEDYLGVELLRHAGKAVLPVEGMTKTICAVCRTSDKVAGKLIELAKL